MRLGVSPAAAPTPTGIFNQRSEALFPHAGALGYGVCFTPRPFVLVYLCASVGPRGATHRSACLVLSHSESGPLGLSVSKCGAAGSASARTACAVHPTLHQSRFRHSHVSPLHPGARLRPSYWSGCMFLFLCTWCRTSLLFHFLSVLVVRGVSVCLPTPPSWFCVSLLSVFFFIIFCFFPFL